ncbi:hypothetical protein OIU91_21425 [Streptomyces sp. NBC_01456]|uniref:hypothetical protein n=1 Tax=unclassified Streptomyces TaxID=2593676 RepID=UPI002E37AE90|nr:MULTISPECIES: hypothetical protein [unclassified Streptomyces]
MRDAIARALTWVLTVLPWTRRPAPGRHSAAHFAQQAAYEPVSVNPWRKPWRGPSAATVREIFHAEEVRSLTPEQRERWWAAAFSAIDVDYDFPTINITGAHRTVSA